MAEHPGTEKLDAWVGMLVTVSSVLRKLEAEMLEKHGLSMTWFDVLNRLDQAPDGRLRMHELEVASVFTRSGMTRLADRLEEAGLVRREPATGDRRGVTLSITDAGTATLRTVWPDHLRGLQEHFAGHITIADAKAIRAATTKIVGQPPPGRHG